MINIDFTNIDNAKIIGRLLPFWARGRKMSLLLQALLYPLISVHQSFQNWALEKYIECQITAQKGYLEWYLKHKLKSHFYDESHSFFVSQDDEEIIEYIKQGYWDNDKLWDNCKFWENGLTINFDEIIIANETLVLAPAIVETVNYSHDDYERDIRNIMSKYMINFNKIKILVAQI